MCVYEQNQFMHLIFNVSLFFYALSFLLSEMLTYLFLLLRKTHLTQNPCASVASLSSYDAKIIGRISHCHYNENMI